MCNEIELSAPQKACNQKSALHSKKDDTNEKDQANILNRADKMLGKHFDHVHLNRLTIESCSPFFYFCTLSDVKHSTLNRIYLTYFSYSLTLSLFSRSFFASVVKICVESNSEGRFTCNILTLFMTLTN